MPSACVSATAVIVWMSKTAMDVTFAATVTSLPTISNFREVKDGSDMEFSKIQSPFGPETFPSVAPWWAAADARSMTPDSPFCSDDSHSFMSA